MNGRLFFASLFLLALLAIVILPVSAAPPSIQWQKSYGSNADDRGYGIEQTSDGGYIVVGWVTQASGDVTSTHGSRDVWVVKLTSTGSIDWQQSYGGSGEDFGYYIHQTFDGGYVVGGNTQSNDGDITLYQGNTDYWIIKLDPGGGIEWQRTYGGSGNEWLTGLRQTSDGGYIAIGYSDSTDGNVTSNYGASDVWVVRLDGSGDLVWQKNYGGSNGESDSAILENSAGDFIFAATTNSNDNDVLVNYGNSDYWFVDLDSLGNINWQKTYGGSGYEQVSGIIGDTGWGYIISGTTDSTNGNVTGNHGGSDFWIVKTDTSGDLNWQKALGGSGNEGVLWDNMREYVAGAEAPVIIGWSDSVDGDRTGFCQESSGVNDYWIVRLTSAGALDWQLSLGGTKNDEGKTLAVTGDGYLIVSGASKSSDNDVTGTHAGSEDLWIAKMRSTLAPVANFTTATTSGTAPFPVRFIDATTNTSTSWSWNFGDGDATNSTKRNPLHTYTSAGTYTVSLTATNSAGSNSKTRTSYITVSSPPVPAADFSGTPTTGVLPLTVTFTDLSSNGPTGWAWFFGDETYAQPWTQQTAGAGWTKRWGHSSVAMPDGGIVLMGGNDGSVYKNDVWRSTDNGATWTMVNASAGSSGRYKHSSVAMPDGSIILMGGDDGSGFRKNDVWKSTNNGAIWTLVNASAGWSERMEHTSIVMPDGSIVLMGGDEGGGDRKNDTWRSTDNGITWTQQAASAEWTARSGHTSIAMADSSIVLMGGYDGNYKNDVWRSTDNGATWTQKTAGAGWTARTIPSSVAMPDSSIVLMGGFDSSLNDKNDVWRSTDNGATWTQVNASAGWSAREYYSIAAMRDGSIVFTGGNYNSGTLKNDTWRFNPAGSSAHNPSHTYNAAGIYQVALQAFNAGGSDSTRKAGYITVTAPGVAPPPPPPDPGGGGDSGGGPAAPPAPAPAPAKEEQQQPEQQQEPQQQQAPPPASPEAQPVPGLAGVTVVESYPVGCPGVSFNADGQNSVSIDLSATAQAHATVTTFFDHVEVYTENSPGVRIFFYFDSYETKANIITGTAKRAEFETNPLVVNVTSGNVSGSIRAVLTSFNQPVKVKNAITGDITQSTVDKYNSLLARDNQTLAGIAYLMDFRRGNFTTTGAANVTMTVPPSWVALHGGKEAVRITRTSDENGITELLKTTYLGTNPGGSMVFRGDSPHGTSLFGLVTAKATAVEKQAHPNETIIPASKPAMITNVGMFGWLVGVITDNPVLIVILIAVLAAAAYFGWWRRRL